jgi:hypothetical protein
MTIESIRLCAQCGKPFGKLRSNATTFCSKECRNQNYYQRAILPRTSFDKRHVQGTLSELLVCVDLLKRGHEVFRAINQFCSCDLTVTINGKSYRVEVRTGYKNRYTNKALPNRKQDPAKSDILAIVLQNEQVVYEPTLESLATSQKAKTA